MFIGGPAGPRALRGRVPWWVLAALACATLLAFLAAGFGVRTLVSDPPSAAATPRSALPAVSVAELPAEARDALRAIDAGGPFRYRQDGSAFGNLERGLPARPRGYYREYTVLTPGESDRGARRLVAGRDGDLYYTDDHYASFRQVLR